MKTINRYINIETSLGDFGVRKYDEEIGRFTSIDPLWEKYLGYTPYHYCGGNPLMATDRGGLKIVPTGSEKDKAIINQYLDKVENSETLGFVLVNVLQSIEQEIEISLVKKFNDGRSGNFTGKNTDPFDMNNENYGEAEFLNGKVELVKSKMSIKTTAHELYHAFEAFYNMSTLLQEGTGKESPAEKRAAAIGYMIENGNTKVSKISYYKYSKKDQNDAATRLMRYYVQAVVYSIIRGFFK